MTIYEQKIKELEETRQAIRPYIFAYEQYKKECESFGYTPMSFEYFIKTFQE